MPRTAAQWDEIRKASRARILSGAVGAFKARGIHGASMDSIARRAGVSKGLAYSYFRSKDELLAAVVEQWLRELAAMWVSVEQESDPLKGLEIVMDRFCKSVERDPDSYRIFFAAFFEREYLAPIRAVGRRSPRLAQQIGKIRRASRDLFKRLGARDPEAEVLFFRLLTSGLAAEFIMSPKGFPMRQMKARILSYYRLLGGAATRGRRR